MSQADGKSTVKIRKHLRPKYFAEPHPSKLLNELLEQYYGYKVTFKKS